MISAWGHWLDNFPHSFLSPVLYGSVLELKVRKSKYLVGISGIEESFPLWKMGGFSYFVIPQNHELLWNSTLKWWVYLLKFSLGNIFEVLNVYLPYFKIPWIIGIF